METSKLGRGDPSRHGQEKTLLILSPHPDDLELSCGLLCHKASMLSWHIREIVMTDGSAGGNDPSLYHSDHLVKQRMEESQRGGSFLGVGHIDFWGYKDACLEHHSIDVAERLADYISSHKPSVITFPSIKDVHPDHRATYIAADDIISKCGQSIIDLQYCFWGTDDRQNVTIINNDGVDAKDLSVKSHLSQPIDKYLSRLYGCDKVNKDSEQYYSVDSVGAASILSSWGFNVS